MLSTASQIMLSHSSDFYITYFTVFSNSLSKVDVFNPGIPDTFRRNYLITLGFLYDFEKFVPIKKFRKTLAYTDFLKKWQINVYYQIRKKDLFTDVTTSEELVTRLKKCWSREIYIPTLLHRIMKLSLGIVQKYILYIDSILDSNTSANQQEELKVYNDIENVKRNVLNVVSDTIIPLLPDSISSQRVYGTFIYHV